MLFGLSVLLIAFVWGSAYIIYRFVKWLNSPYKPVTQADVSKYMGPVNQDLGPFIEISNVLFTRFYDNYEPFYIDPSNRYIYSRDNRFENPNFFWKSGIMISESEFLNSIEPYREIPVSNESLKMMY